MDSVEDIEFCQMKGSNSNRHCRISSGSLSHRSCVSTMMKFDIYEQMVYIVRGTKRKFPTEEEPHSQWAYMNHPVSSCLILSHTRTSETTGCHRQGSLRHNIHLSHPVSSCLILSHPVSSSSHPRLILSHPVSSCLILSVTRKDV